jgi:DHA1 family bicyclomycin/chloramphenicol resistance-like MFS transporter
VNAPTPTSGSHLSHPVALAALLAGLAMFGPFTIDAFFPAFHAIAEELQASPLQMQQTISLYLLGYALMALLHGPLSDAYGRRRIILHGVIAFTLASIGCALARNIETLLLFRFLQGCSTGAGMIVGRALVRDLYQGAEAQRVMAMISMFFGIAPAIAPVIGALIFTVSNWHAVFLFLVGYGLVLWLLCLRLLPETHPSSARSVFRPLPLMRTYVGIVRDWRFLLLVVAASGNFGSQFLYISSAPNYVERFLGLGSFGYAWFFLPMIGGMTLGSYASSRLAARISPEVCTQRGYVVMAVAMALNLIYNLIDRSPSVPWAVIPNFVYAFGVALAFPPTNLLMLDRHPQHRGAASSVQAFVSGLIMAFISGIAAGFVLRSALHLAIGALMLFLVGWLAWWLYLRHTPKNDHPAPLPPVPEADEVPV